MAPRRNDPCTCGSGRKYKHCCGSSAAGARLSENVRERVRQLAGEARSWDVDAFPLMIRFSEDEARRPVALLVVADDLVIQHDILPSLSGEPGEVASALESGIAAAAREIGSYPERVRVRHAEVADELRTRLAQRQVLVDAAASLPGLEEAARALTAKIAGRATWPPICMTDRWSGWTLPPALVSELFTAAAAFWRASPWRIMANLQAPAARLASGREWTASVLGNAGEQFGLVMYSDPRDLFERVTHADPEDPFASVTGRILSITFDPVSRMREAAREARLARWEVAGAMAFPTLMTVNTSGGGVSQAEGRDMITLLGAMPEFARVHAKGLVREERIGTPCRVAWRHEASGTRFSYAGDAVTAVAESPEPEVMLPFALPEHLQDAVEAALVEEAAGLAEGEDPAVLLERVQERLRGPTEAYNRAPQRELGGLSPGQVLRLMQGDWSTGHGAIELRRDLSARELAGSSLLPNARILLEFALERGALGATQAGNLQVRVVTELIDRLRLDDELMSFLRDQKQIREHDVEPLHELRVVTQLAGLLVPIGRRFEPSEKARALVAPERSGELYTLLFGTFFREFNLAYGSWVDWPELQHQVAFTLYRLGIVAKKWREARELVEQVVLPFALERAPRHAGLDVSALTLEAQVLAPLVDFGLLESDRDPAQYSLLDGDKLRKELRYRITPLFGKFMRFEL